MLHNPGESAKPKEKWIKPRRFDRNLIVIGAGSAGLVSAYIAAATKARVTLVEAHKMGGDCLNTGCIPSKALIKSAKIAHQIRHAADYGINAGAPEISFRSVMQRIQSVIAKVEPHDSVQRYSELGVDVVGGHARLLDPWTVEITSDVAPPQQLTTQAIIIASGASPFVPPLPGLETSEYVTSDTMWERFRNLDAAPRDLVVLGGGPIGTELAQSFARLGSRVTQIEMAPRLLVREDAEVSDLVQKSLEADGVKVLTSHKAVACGRDSQDKWIEVEHAGMQSRIRFDQLIIAIGRSPRLQGLGLEDLGIRTNRVIETNEYLQTIHPNILAAGDVAGPYQFTHAAGHQAWFAAVNALFGIVKRFKVDYSLMPWATFCDPEVARVGLSQAEATERNIAFEVTHYDLGDLDRAIADGSARGFIKILTPPGKDRILGVTIVGDHAGELIAEFVLAMKLRVGLSKILSTIHIYPTWTDANKLAAGTWRKAHVNATGLRLLERFHTWRRG